MQTHDSALAQLAHRKKNLPEHARLVELSAQQKELDGQRIEHETAASDLTREQAKAEREVQQVRDRKTRDEDRMNSGAITNPKDLTNLQHELGALDRRITTLEDEELEVMERLEDAQRSLDAVTAQLADVQQSVADATVSRDAAVASIDKEAATHVAEREAIVGEIPADLLTLYDKVRGQQGGLGAAGLRRKRCDGCRLELNAADLREIAAEPDDAVLRCPECNRILVRTEESGL